MQHPEIPALSHYVPAHEGPEDALVKDFPLQLITWKGKNRANSTQYANPWLIEVQQQTLWINPQDAQKRGITHGDMVRIHNSTRDLRNPGGSDAAHYSRRCRNAGWRLVAAG
ncbi:putative anaerobic dimethylsulfoxide reductase [Salmonella enterica subsp. enterica]|nr:putative anaerobic dimethylsulfoxide reductase [Salmonella enterica subsp. enterica]